MEMIRDKEERGEQEVRGEIEPRGARAAWCDARFGQAIHAIVDEGAYPAESGRVRGWRGLDGRRNRGGVGHLRQHRRNLRRHFVEEGFEARLRRKYNPNAARPRIFDGAAETK